MGNVTPLDAAQDPETLLEAAKRWDLADVLIVGYDRDGELAAGATRTLSVADCYFLLGQLNQYLLDNHDGRATGSEDGG